MTSIKQHRHVPALLLCTLLVFCGLLATAVAAPSGVPLDDSTGTLYIGQQVEYMEDRAGALFITDVTDMEDRWKASDSTALSFGFTSSTYWFRFTLDNTTDRPRDFYLEFAYPLLDFIELYTPQTEGLFNTIKAGDHYPFSTREIIDKDFVFLLTQAPGPATYYVKVKTSSSLNFEPVVRSHNSYLSKINRTYPIFWLYYGAMLIMVIYNLVLVFVIRERSYLFLVLLILSYSLFQFTLNGFSFQYLWPNSIWWANNCLPMFMGLAMAIAMLFMRSFIGIRERHAKSLVDRVSIYLVIIPNTAWAVGSLLLPYAVSIRVATALIIFSLVVVIPSGFISLSFTRSIRFIVISCACLFIGILLFALKTFGLLPSNFITQWGVQIGSAVFIALLSIGLADKITAMKDELITTNSNISLMLQSISQEVEVQENDLEKYKEEEIGDILNERFHTFMDRFKDLVDDVNSNTNLLKSSSANLLALSDKMTSETAEISANSNSVASASEEMSSKMVAIASTMEQTSQNVNLIVSSVEEMTTTSDEISMSTESARQTTENAVAQAKNVSQKVDNLGIAAERIGTVTEVIAEISKKTNLLALNATIEAARAGEAGKGFAVVANEIKDLARQTADATQQINRQIEENKQVTVAAVKEIGQIVETIKNVNEIVSTIASAIEEQSISIREIASNVAQISQGISGVNKGVSQCSIVANNVSKEVVSLSASSKQMNSNSLTVRESADDLLKMAQHLTELMQKFKV
ncbi:7TM diverse intracellular signaling domain-containing protein [Desulfosudis oleivorans]|uniref:Methyl-accepting chemotaxis sensory transducer n=1 Tax=Desulfosudis oleivorans (strain DSM 6200 / JCM 39069 / Hxd3) TaxID=96561 RepID=A9A0I6_DESOH|nr:7TM diverse intracellular signaling domain-containing protein [Desulfosudis oleivorans]ABW67486.1 methyl-accepting chemotaxis sensory transducer [Desulfosudis oleivorans Hxd3]